MYSSNSEQNRKEILTIDMRQYRISPGENQPSNNAQTWIIPMPNMTPSSTNNNQDPPSYNEVLTSTSNQSNDLPPNYFNLSIVPRGVVLYYDEIVPLTEPSKATIVRKNERIVSYDSLIDKNPDQLWLYFMTYLKEKPRLFVNLSGYHAEEVSMHSAYRPRYNHSIRLVTDFNFSIELTSYVSEHYLRIAVFPSKPKTNKNENISFRDALEQYTRSDKYFKEIQCQKQLIGWNFHELNSKIKQLICSTGYSGNISIKFNVNNQRIIARSPSKLIRFVNSFWTRILCVLSCFFLIFAPIYFCLRKAGSTRHHIVADYNMKSSIRNFLQKNSGLIQNSTISRSKGRFMAKFA